MNAHLFRTIILAVAVVSSLSGCGKKSDHAEKEGEDGHGHEEGESPSGAAFKPGKGVILTDETRKILGLEIAEASEQRLDDQIQANMQVFGETDHHPGLDTDHTGCDVHGSALISQERASQIQTGLLALVQFPPSLTLTGAVVAVQKAIARGESEAVIGVTNGANQLKAGQFAKVTILLPRKEAVTVIAKSAVLRTSEGTFAYVANGNAYIRTAIKLGAEGSDFVEVTDGLYSGDQVVTKPVQTLWLIELRATKGGGHSH